MRRSVAAAGCFCVAIAATGCDTIKSLAGVGEGGTSSSPLGLSFLGSDFEGEITMKVTDHEAATGGNPKASLPQQLVIGMKKPKYRVDISGMTAAATAATQGAGGFILDLPTKKGWVLIPPQKTAMLIDLNEMKDMKGLPGAPGGAPPRGAPTAPPKPPSITNTGKKDTVAGYSCDIWEIISEGKKADICFAEGITWVDVSSLGVSAPGLSLAAFATEGNHFPLRVIGYNVQGAEEMRMEATKIEKKSLPDTNFAPPPDYKIVDLAQMMQGNGLPGGPPGGRPGVPPGFPQKH